MSDIDAEEKPPRLLKSRKAGQEGYWASRRGLLLKPIPALSEALRQLLGDAVSTSDGGRAWVVAEGRCD
jgi:hypothetical protein